MCKIDFKRFDRTTFYRYSINVSELTIKYLSFMMKTLVEYCGGTSLLNCFQFHSFQNILFQVVSKWEESFKMSFQIDFEERLSSCNYLVNRI